MDDDYELLSHRELEKLREEIQELKGHPLENNAHASTLKDSIDELNKSIKLLISIFKEADKQIISEYHQGYHQSQDKLDQLLDQSQKIAKGVVAVAEIVKKDEMLDEETLERIDRPETSIIRSDPEPSYAQMRARTQQNYFSEKPKSMILEDQDELMAPPPKPNNKNNFEDFDVPPPLEKPSRKLPDLEDSDVPKPLPDVSK